MMYICGAITFALSALTPCTKKRITRCVYNLHGCVALSAITVERVAEGEIRVFYFTIIVIANI